MARKKLHTLRQEYQGIQLKEDLLPSEPFPLFASWFQEALEAGIREPNAMTLATADRKGQASARIVLMKEYGPEGFVFFTNYSSRKGKELEENPSAALLFFWDILFRQIRIEGRVVHIPAEDSDVYFQSRPLESQISALASPQSEIVAGRNALETRWKEIQQKALDGLWRPDFWGGYLLIPERVEFWQGQANRLHDRILYSKEADSWKFVRLAP